MIKKMMLLIICFSCNQPGISDTLSTNNHETRIKSILSSVYNAHEKKFYPSRERIINYSINKDQLEYKEYRNGKEIVEKHIAEYQDNKLVSHITGFADTKFKSFYEYNHFGDLVNYIFINNDYHYQDTFIYVNQRLVNHKMYAWKEATNKTLTTEEKFAYDSDNNTMNKTITSPSETKSIKYTNNSEKQITSKTEEYVQYKIDYEGDTLIKIEKKEGISSDNEITNTTIKFTPNGQLGEVVIEGRYEKNISTYSYNENNNLSELTYTEKFLSGTKNYTKYEFGPYNIKSKFIFPSWFINCGILNNNIVNDVDYFINENQLSNSIRNGLGRFFKSFPDYYIEYQSKDGINWIPTTRMDFKFETIKK